jgi:hypothetical protein
LRAFDSVDVTPGNQKELGLDFKLTAYRSEQVWVVEFVVPAKSKLQAITNVSAFSPQSDSNALSVAFAGLTRFPRDNPRKPKEVQWVKGVQFWVGNAILADTQIQFKYGGEDYIIFLRDYFTPEPDQALRGDKKGPPAQDAQAAPNDSQK